MKRHVIALLAAILLPSAAVSQSSPNWSRGYVPSAGEINNAFSKKQDKLQYTPLSQSGGTMTGKLQAAPATINGAGLSILPGVAPTAPSNGDLWSTGVGLFGRFGSRTLAIPGMDQNTGALSVPGGPTLGTYQNGQFTSQPYKIQIQGSGSTGDVSAMSVTGGSTTLAIPSFIRALPQGINTTLSDPDANVYVSRILSGNEDSTSRSESNRSAFNAFLQYDRILQPGSWYGVGAAAYNTGGFYGFYTPARGGVTGWRVMSFLGAGADDTLGRTSGEISIGTGFIKAVSQLPNKNMAVWGFDFGIDGPASNTAGAQEATFTGLSYQLHKMTPGNAWVAGTGANNGADYKRPSVGMHLLSYPALAYHNKLDYGRSGIDDSPTGVVMYPLDAVYAASGCSGPITTVTDCDNAAATPMANTVFRMGGTPPGPYINPGTNAPSKSKFLNGFEFNDYTGIAAWFRTTHASATSSARSIKVEAGAGTVEINAATIHGGALSMVQGSPSFLLNDLGSPTANQKRLAMLMYQGDAYFQRQNDDGSASANVMMFSKDGSTIKLGSLLKLTTSTVSGLPACNATNQDAMAVVTDATSPTYRGALTGGGSVRTPVYCDSSTWTAH